MSADQYYRDASRHMAAGEWQVARDLVRAGVIADPHHGRLHEQLGLVEYALEDFAAALFHLETATAIVPLTVRAQLALAELYLKFGHTESAEAIARFLAEEDRCPTALLPRLARLLGGCGECDLALEVCQRLTVLRPTFHSAWYGAAVYLDSLGRSPDEIAVPLRQAFALAPQVLVYRLSLAGVLADTGGEDEAYQLLADVSPSIVRCGCQCRRFARVCDLAGDTARADEYRRRAEDTPPKLDYPLD